MNWRRHVLVMLVVGAVCGAVGGGLLYGCGVETFAGFLGGLVGLGLGSALPIAAGCVAVGEWRAERRARRER